jgi:RNA polymerase sigma-70 factor (ECF subfamily)
MSGSNREFEWLVEAYERRLYNVALKFTGNPEEAADLTQDTFVRAFRAWPRFRKEAGAYTWLYRILVNLNKDRIARDARKRDREAYVGGEGGEWERIPYQGPSPDDSARSGELRGALQEAIGRLPMGYRECVVLKDMEGLSYEEIAQVMDITVEAVRSRLARARQQLREALSPYLQA